MTTTNKIIPSSQVVPSSKTTTNKIIPSSQVVPSSDVRKWVPRVVIALAVIITIAIIASVVHKHNAQKQLSARPSSRSEIPLASAPLAEWPRLTLPATVGGRVDIPVHPGKRPLINGDQVRIHSVYRDNTECIRASEGDESNVLCNRGNAVAVYVTNKIASENMISYAYEEK